MKDNRILPAGFLKLEDRIQISKAIGADESMAVESRPDDGSATIPITSAAEATR